MCLARVCLWQFRQQKEIFGNRENYIRKNIQLFLLCGGLHSCRKVNYIWSSHFPEAIRTNMLIGNEFFVFKYQLKFKNIFAYSHYFYWHLVKRLTFICPLTYDKYNLSYTYTYQTKNVSYLLDFHVSANILFSHFEELKARFSHRYVSPHQLCTDDFRVFQCQ